MTNNLPVTQTLAEHAYEAFTQDIPAAVQASVRQRILDVLGLSIGAQALETSGFIKQYAHNQASSHQATGIGLTETLSPETAALLNGVLAHSLDYDDTHLPSILHPSACVIPAALAMAESVKATDAEVIASIACGLEVTVRLGMAGYDSELGNSIFFEHGQHATSICGALGAATAAGLLLGFDATGIRNVLGITASMAAGIIEANRTGGTVKRLHCGWAAQSGISAAGLVQAGFTGPPTALEGRFGFFQAFLHGAGDYSHFVPTFAQAWCIQDIFFKPYPANHFTHAIIDAGRALQQQNISPEEIEHVRIGVPAAVIRTIGEPIEIKRTPETGYQAQFSGPYAFVAGLLGTTGLGVTLADFTDELAQEPLRRELMSRIDIEPDDICNEIFPSQFPARVRVTFRDGTEQLLEILANRGGNKNPLSDEELALKFRHNVSEYLPDEITAQVERLVLTMGDTKHITQVFQLIRENLR